MTLQEQFREVRLALAATAARTVEEAALLAKAQYRSRSDLLLRAAMLRVAEAEIRQEAEAAAGR